MTVPFAANISGDPIFPHNGDPATDVTISSPTTWGVADYPGRVVLLNRLDVDDVLTLAGSPWFIFVDTLDMGASGEIRCDGPDGDTGAEASSIYTRGAYVLSTGAAAGGCGGGMLLICAGNITGTASRPISANGGDGARNTTNAVSNVGRGGEGAFDELTSQTTSTSTPGTLDFYTNLLGAGAGSTTVAGMGGGSGGVTSSGTIAGGGSGIGGGAAAGSAGATTSGSTARNIPSVLHIAELALLGCRGGGGGGAVVSSTGTNNAAGGGGGGAVVLWYQTSSAMPTLSATGGASVGTSSNPGADGVTYAVQVP